MMNRQVSETESSKNNSKSKFLTQKVVNFPSKHIDFGKVISGPMESYKEFRIK